MSDHLSAIARVGSYLTATPITPRKKDRSVDAGDTFLRIFLNCAIQAATSALLGQYIFSLDWRQAATLGGISTLFMGTVGAYIRYNNEQFGEKAYLRVLSYAAAGEAARRYWGMNIYQAVLCAAAFDTIGRAPQKILAQIKTI